MKHVCANPIRISNGKKSGSKDRKFVPIETNRRVLIERDMLSNLISGFEIIITSTEKKTERDLKTLVQTKRSRGTRFRSLSAAAVRLSLAEIAAF
jgi:hypothetical protein